MNDIYELIFQSENILRTEKVCDACTDRLKELRLRMEAGTVTVAVIGQFKRGKSTFLNFVLGEEILPVGIIPVTTAVTRLLYGEKSALVHFKTGETSRIHFDELPKYLSEKNNSNNKLGVISVDIQMPCPLFKNGVVLVDTPGVGSVHKHNTQAAYDFVRDSDAVIFMLSVDSPLNEIELNFLAEAKEYAAKIYFAVNKIDTVNSEEIEAYMEYCREILSKTLEREVHLFAISAKSGEGVTSLMDKITEDCRRESHEILEHSISIKAGGVLDSAISQIELTCSAMKMPTEHLEKMKAELEKRMITLKMMSKQSALLLNQSAEELLASIKLSFEKKGEELYKERESLITETFQKHNAVNPSRLESLFNDLIDEVLYDKLAVINEKELSAFKLGYEDMTKQVSEQMYGLKKYISDCISELFGVKYNYEKREYKLSERNDFFYISVTKPHSFYSSEFWDKPFFDIFLPKRIACKRVYRRTLREVKADITRNLRSIHSNYRYKLRESVRSFSLLFQTETANLEKELKNVIEKAIADKSKNESEIVENLYHLIETANKLCRIKDLLQEK